MLKDLIFIENEKSYQFDNLEQLVEFLMGDGYGNLSTEEKLNSMKLNALAKCVNTGLEVVEFSDGIDLKNKFIIHDEKTYILSLLLTKRATLLEKITSNIFTSKLDKTNISENYIIVNTFAEELLKEYFA